MNHFLTLTFLIAMFVLSSCAMKSGRYVNKNGKWIFVQSTVGFAHQFGNPRVDGSPFDYSESELFIWPVPSSKKISSFFGPRSGKHHDGIDIPAKKGTSVVAAADGKVIFSGRMRGYGKVVVVKHSTGHHTVYGHNSKNYATKGQKVSQGEVIAKVGSTGRSTGNHLHFEIRKKNRVRNPENYLAWVRRYRLAHKK